MHCPGYMGCRVCNGYIRSAQRLRHDGMRGRAGTCLSVRPGPGQLHRRAAKTTRCNVDQWHALFSTVEIFEFRSIVVLGLGMQHATGGRGVRRPGRGGTGAAWTRQNQMLQQDDLAKQSIPSQSQRPNGARCLPGRRQDAACKLFTISKLSLGRIKDHLDRECGDLVSTTASTWSYMVFSARRPLQASACP